jgi:hypothetical protein
MFEKNVTDMTVTQLNKFMEEKGADPDATWLVYGGCGSHMVYLTDDKGADVHLMTEDERLQYEQEQLERTQRRAAEEELAKQARIAEEAQYREKGVWPE